MTGVCIQLVLKAVTTEREDKEVGERLPLLGVQEQPTGHDGYHWYVPFRPGSFLLGERPPRYTASRLRALKA